MRYDMSGNQMYDDNYETSPEDYGYVRMDEFEELEKRMEDVKHFCGGIIESVYETGNVMLLEHCLDQISGLLSLQMPSATKETKIERKGSKDMINYQLGYQRGVLDMVRKSIKGGE